jgi:D-amino-acid oxidase
LERAYKLCPQITHGKGTAAFDIISVNVGFRPGRAGGIRLEKEIRRRLNYFHANRGSKKNLGRSDGQKVTVCHNYGHGSHGKKTQISC